MLRTSSSRSTKKSALSWVMHSGGLILSTFEWSPVAWSMTPSSRSRSQIAVASSVAGSRVSGISHQLDALVEAAAVDAADDRVPLGERAEPLRQVRAHSCGVVLQVLLANRVEYRQPDG